MPTERKVPYYRPLNGEVEIFRSARKCLLPLLLQGPTGCGKSRFVEYCANREGVEVISVACNEDTSASDLLGRFLIKNGDTVWQDGPVTRAVRTGSVLYLDEIAEAREDVVVLLHSLSDHRRELYLDRTNEVLRAPPEFQLVVSYNPGYQRGLKELKPSTRQRFVGLSFSYPEPKVEQEILEHETGAPPALCTKLVQLAVKIRALHELGLSETISTRLLVHAAKLVVNGLPERAACRVAIAEPLTDDTDTRDALVDLIHLSF